jgi:RHS repeat-associated protein
MGTYTANGSELATTQVAVSGQVQASASVSYDSFGRVWSIGYNGGQMTATTSYDAYGRQSWMLFEKNTTPEPTRITGHAVTRSVGGRVVDAWVDTGGFDLVDANPAGDNYLYDGAGRLTTAHLPGGVASYGYANNPPADNCTTHATGINPQAGRNTNRTATTWTPTGGTAVSTRACFNTADQLVASIAGSTVTTGYTYDTRGNQTRDDADTYTWDSADRLRTITNAGTTITYTRDALDRLTQRTQNTTTTRYSYNGYSDSPAAVLDSTNSLLQQFHTLPGGVLVTINHPGLTRTLSYPDLNGNYTTTTDHTGTLTTTTRIHYGPWGERLPSSTGTLDNASGNLDAGAFGQHGKLEEDTTQRTIITMGARLYSPRDGRFLTIDPIKGGCANDYVYVAGDPLNQRDTSGKALSTCVGTHILPNGNVRVQLGTTASGSLQIGVEFTARPHQGALAQLLYYGSSVSIRAPGLGLNFFKSHDANFVPGSILELVVPAGRPSLRPSGIQLDIHIQYAFWGVGYRADAPDLLNTEVAGNLALNVSCSL